MIDRLVSLYTYTTLYINTGLNVAEHGTKNICNAKVKDGFKENCISFFKNCVYTFGLKIMYHSLMSNI